MTRLVDEYRGYDLWRTWKSTTYRKSDGTEVKGTTACYHAIHKEGKYPPIKPSTCMRKDLIKKRIDEALEQPPAEKVYEVPPDVPRQVDTYQGIAIYYYPDRDQYYAKVPLERCEGASAHGAYHDTIDETHAFIDQTLYKDSEIYQEEKARKKAEQEAALERARIYGIGTDEYGDEIPPTDEEIKVRETYYAKVKASGGDTVREEFEEREGITITDEEREVREEYQEAELVAQRKYLDLYWLRLKSEWRKLTSSLFPVQKTGLKAEPSTEPKPDIMPAPTPEGPHLVTEPPGIIYTKLQRRER